MNFLLLFLATLAIVIIGIPIAILKLAMNKKRKMYAFILAYGIDRLGAVVLYKKLGWTVSSITFYRYTTIEKDKKKKGKYFMFMKLINTIFFDPFHCQNSFTRERNRRKKNTLLTSIKDRRENVY